VSNDIVDSRGLDRPQIARAWDGLDGHEVCAAMEAAFDVLGLYETALTRR
jgi:hypothetical protein